MRRRSSATRARRGATSSIATTAERLISSIEAHFRRESAAYECEFRVRHKDGHWVWLLSRGKVVERDALDTPVRMTGTHMDLTRRKSTEAEVQRSAEMLRRTGELANIGGWELDLATMRYDWTEQVFRIHEIEPGPTPRLEKAMSHYPPEGRPALLAAIEAGAREGNARGTSSCRSSPPRATALGALAGRRRLRGRPAGAPARRVPGHHREEEQRARAAPAERGADAAVDDRRARLRSATGACSTRR
jgi:hypothetical protein